jgi:glycosyltransferase involved in cell wall biosynthesis
MKKIIIGIDASNLLEGGGVTHLIEVLKYSNPNYDYFDKIIIWGCEKTLSKIEKKAWIEKKQHTFLEKNLFFRLYWKIFILKNQLIENNCSILFSPGGSDISNYKPMVTMCRNMLPFEVEESIRFGFGLKTIKFFILRYFQSKTFKNSNGLIFLTEYAYKKVNEIINLPNERSVIIPHGISKSFFIKPIERSSLINNERLYKLIYVSKTDPYKHHLNVIKAVQLLIENRYTVKLILIGPPGACSKKVDFEIKKINSTGNYIENLGAIPYDVLNKYYENADIAIFASSCENMPNILLESMASGLPIACSNKGPMPEILGNAGVYFNPDSVKEIYISLKELINSEDLRIKLSSQSFAKVHEYSWEKCTRKTFQYLNHTVNIYKKNENKK